MKTKKMEQLKLINILKPAAENVYAIGDVIDRIQLTPVAIAEAMIFVENLKLKKKNLLIIQISPRLYLVILNYSFVGFSRGIRLSRKIQKC